MQQERWGDRYTPLLSRAVGRPLHTTSTNEYTVTDTPVELMELIELMDKCDKWLRKTYGTYA